MPCPRYRPSKGFAFLWNNILHPSPWLSLGPHFLPLFRLLSSSYWCWGSLMNKQACNWGLHSLWPQPGSLLSLISTWIVPWFNQVSQIKHLFTESSLTSQLQKQPHHHALLPCPGHHLEGGGCVCVYNPHQDVHSRSREGDFSRLIHCCVFSAYKNTWCIVGAQKCVIN